MKDAKQKAYRHGVWAEFLAALYLRLRGYRILKLRYKTKVGEIDLIALKGDTLVMVEVKARAGLDEALSSVGPRSRKRIENAARYFLMNNPHYAQHAIRFDLIAFGQGFRLRHLDNAWPART